ncbi:MAG: glycosyltransferase family 4 protein [Kiritimatiellaeota bacterium]|nr:glycosyltransferase family 4 protein [Kiritimatiellota bacterium]
MPPIVYNAMVLREPYSGVEVTVHQLLCSLAQHGTCPVRAYVPHGCRPVPPSAQVLLRPCRAARPRLVRILWEQACLPVLLRRANAPLLHAPAYVAPLAAPCPTVLTVHDLHALTHPQFCTAANRLHYSLLLPRSIRRAAAIIVFSDYTRRTVISRFPEAAARITVIPPGISPGFKRCTDETALRTARARYDLPEDFLLFVGDLTDRKNLGGLLAAFAHVRARHPDLHLVLAGAAPPGAAAALERTLHALGLDGHIVRRTGYVAQADMPALYSLARLFMFPSHDEGFGLPPLEAMACGCPVVCSGGATLEICAGAALTCDPGDPAAIAGAVGEVLGNPATRHGRVLAGYAAAARFSWENAARATETVYRKIIRDF